MDLTTARQKCKEIEIAKKMDTLLKIIRGSPGINFTNLVEASGMSCNIARRLVRRLADEDKVSIVKIGHHMRFTLSGLPLIPTTQEVLLKIIRNNPGINYTELAKESSISYSHVIQLVEKLANENRVSIVKIDRKQIHIVPSEFVDENRPPVLENPTARKILEAVRTKKCPVGSTEIGKILEISRKIARNLLNRLVEAGLLERVPGYHTKYRSPVN